jgi:hypothetical protein
MPYALPEMVETQPAGETHTPSWDELSGAVSECIRSLVADFVSAACAPEGTCPASRGACPHQKQPGVKTSEGNAKKQKTTTSFYFDSAQTRSRFLLRSLLHGLDHPARPDLDTSEYRPSDARNGEFDPIPF